MAITNRKIFADGLLSILIGGFTYVRPDLIVPFVFSGEGDGVQWHLVRCIGAQTAGLGLTLLALGTSHNRPSHTTVAHMRLLMSILVLCMSVHALRHNPDIFVPNFLAVLIGVCLASVLWNIQQLVHNKSVLGASLPHKEQVLGQAIIQLDVFASLIIGIMWIAFPDWILIRQIKMKVVSEEIIFVGRILGVVFTSTHFMSTQCLYWSRAADRKFWAYGRALMCFGIFSAQIWSQYAYHSWWTDRHWAGITLFSIWTSLALWFNFMMAKGNFK